MEEVERVQYRAALAVTGAWKGTSRTKLYNELGWESLSDRRILHRLLQIQKIITKNTPSYLRDKLPPVANPFSETPDLNLLEFHCRTKRFQMTFYPDAVTNWNNTIVHFQEMPTKAALKSHIDSLVKPKKRSTFGIYDPQGIRWLYMLRLGLSPLRNHKMRHNFADTPVDLCLCKTGIEDTEHFLFKCPFFASSRMALASTVILILIQQNLAHVGNSVETYLYGHVSLSEDDNRSILLATIKYIKGSHRFTSENA